MRGRPPGWYLDLKLSTDHTARIFIAFNEGTLLPWLSMHLSQFFLIRCIAIVRYVAIYVVEVRKIQYHVFHVNPYNSVLFNRHVYSACIYIHVDKTYFLRSGHKLCLKVLFLFLHSMFEVLLLVV